MSIMTVSIPAERCAVAVLTNSPVEEYETRFAYKGGDPEAVSSWGRPVVVVFDSAYVYRNQYAGVEVPALLAVDFPNEAVFRRLIGAHHIRLSMELERDWELHRAPDISWVRFIVERQDLSEKDRDELANDLLQVLASNKSRPFLRKEEP